MKIVFSCILICLLSCSNGNRVSDPPTDQEKKNINYQILIILNKLEKIKPGMQRSDLNGILTTEGGRSNRTDHVYVMEECMYIKVLIKFKAPTVNPESYNEDGSDVIDSVGTPYLQFPIYD